MEAGEERSLQSHIPAYIYAVLSTSFFHALPAFFFASAPAMPAPALSPAKLRQLQARYQRCKEQLAALDWISEGSVTPNNSPGAWRWTRKVRAKTVTVALSAAQAEAFRRAIAQHRRLEALIKEMRALSQQVLLQSIPGPRRRTPKTVPKPA
jgi:hypothetical protein